MKCVFFSSPLTCEVRSTISCIDSLGFHVASQGFDRTTKSLLSWGNGVQAFWEPWKINIWLSFLFMVDFSFFLGRNLNFLCSFFLDLRETSSRILKSLFTGVGHGNLRLKSYHKLVLPWPYPAPQFTKQQAERSFQNAELILHPA